MDRLLSMRVFQNVVDEGGFAAAARKLRLTPAAVTRLVGDLEQHLGVRLLQRTTRRLSLTPAGEAYLNRLRAILADIDEADAMAHAHTREMSGTVRVLALPVVATHILAPAVREFQDAHPEVVIDVDVSESGDPNVEDYDLTVLNSLVQMHPSTIVRTISESQAVFCASPDYLRRHGEPKTPEDLHRHRSLRLKLPGGRVRPLRAIDPTDNDRELVLDVPAAFAANHVDTLLRATVEGAGISSQATELIAPMLRTGYLQRVLAPWITARVTLFAALPSRKYMPARTRAFLDHLVERTRRSMSAAGVALPPAPAVPE